MPNRFESPLGETGAEGPWESSDWVLGTRIPFYPVMLSSPKTFRSPVLDLSTSIELSPRFSWRLWDLDP